MRSSLCSCGRWACQPIYLFLCRLSCEGKFGGGASGVCSDYFSVRGTGSASGIFPGSWNDDADVLFSDTGADTECCGEYRGCLWICFHGGAGIGYDKGCLWGGRERSGNRRGSADRSAFYAGCVYTEQKDDSEAGQKRHYASG